jgi:peptide/nickel transport system permease protein
MESSTHAFASRGTDRAERRRARAAARAARRSGSTRAQLVAGCTLLGAIALAAIVVPLVSSYSPNDLVATPLEAPSSDHLFGTDSLGRDVFTRVFAAARIDLLVSVAAIVPAFAVGTAIGAGVGYSQRRWADVTLMRLTDAVIAFPFVVLVLVIVVLFGADKGYLGLPAGVPAFLVAVYIIAWAFYARVARAEALSLRSREYIVATRVLGYSRARVLTRHLLPAVGRAAFTLAVADMVAVIGTLAALPFLGAGVQPPTAEWGAMMFDGRTNLETAWWAVAAPCAALLLTGIALTTIGDALLERSADR